MLRIKLKPKKGRQNIENIVRKLQTDSSTPEESERLGAVEIHFDDTTGRKVSTQGDILQNSNQAESHIENSPLHQKPCDDPKKGKTTTEKKVGNKRKKSTPAKCKERKTEEHGLPCISTGFTVLEKSQHERINHVEYQEDPSDSCVNSLGTSCNIIGEIVKVEPQSPESFHEKDDVEDANNSCTERIGNTEILSKGEKQNSSDNLYKLNLAEDRDLFESENGNSRDTFRDGRLNSSPDHDINKKEKVTIVEISRKGFDENSTLLDGDRDNTCTQNKMLQDKTCSTGRVAAKKRGNIFVKMGFSRDRYAAHPVHPIQDTTAHKKTAGDNKVENKLEGISCDKLALEDFSDEELLDLLETDSGIFKCDCSLIFTDEIMYFLHRNVHGSGGKFHCGFCDHEANDKYFFMIHQIQAHRCSGNPT